MNAILCKLILVNVLILAISSHAVADDDPSIRIFDGEPRLLIVHGYSTSQHWWAFLQRKIDRYSGGPVNRVIEVRLCNKGGTPIARWMSLESGKRSEAWEQMLTPMISAEQRKRPVPILARILRQWIEATDQQEDRHVGAQDGQRMTTDAISPALPGCRPLPLLGGHERKRANVRGQVRECVFFGDDHFANMGVVKVVGESPVTRRCEHQQAQRVERHPCQSRSPQQ